MSVATTSSEGQNVKISWVEPFNNADVIVEYKIWIRAKDGEYY